MFLRKKMKNSMNSSLENKISQIKEKLAEADAVVIGAGAGLSTSAGFTYSGARFDQYFSDFSQKYHFSDMYSGGFYPYETLEEHWAYWSRYIYINRYMDAPKPVYDRLFDLVKDKDYFVLTTNVDHYFQKAGFEKKRLFYTQGDYGLWQCSQPCCQETYDNKEMVKEMLRAQGYDFSADGNLTGPQEQKEKENRHIPFNLVPKCPHCGKPMTMNLRADEKFVEDEGWHQAAERYENFLRTRKNCKILFLELGVGYNTPGIIKYPFWKMTGTMPEATYVCLNHGEAYAPEEIRKKSICVNGDIGEILISIMEER